jgi:hypothetical protein
MKSLLWVGAAGLAVTITSVAAAPPAELDYQGKVLVNDLPYTGNGYFKFVLADGLSTSNVWAHDGTHDLEPAGHLTNAVVNGVFSTTLGAAPMTAIQPRIFADYSDLRLRVWFSTATSNFAEMLPRQELTSVGYALNAGLLEGYHATGIVAAATNAVTLSGDVSGPVGNVQIAANAVGSAEIAGLSIVDGDISASAAITGTKVQQGTTSIRGTLQLASGTTGTQAIGPGHPYLNAYGSVNTLSAAAPNSPLSIVGVGAVYVSNQAPATVRIGLSGVALPNFDNVVWVATNGSAAGPGTISQPYDTPQNGYNAAMALFPNVPATLVIAGGSYGDLDLNAGNIHVEGLARPQLNRLRVAASRSAFMESKVRVEGLVITGQLSQIVFLNVTGVKFRNVKFLEGFWLLGQDIEMEDCYITQRSEVNFGALRIGDGGSTVSTVSLHNCSIAVSSPNLPALKVESHIEQLEVLWCEIVNNGGGPAITDAETGPISPVHLYAHNWIKGPPPTAPATAFNDWQVQQGPTIGFYHNTVFGHVGFANGGTPHTQCYANNAVHGLINWPGAGVVGWQQGCGGTGADAANNTEFQLEYPALPDAWHD